MRFEVSERIRSKIPQEDLLVFLEEEFKEVSRSVQRVDQTIEVKSIGTKSLWAAERVSDLRVDSTSITVRNASDGWFVVANVEYRPSKTLWVFVALMGLFLALVGAVIPVVIYDIQKGFVQRTITKRFERVKNKFEQPGIGSIGGSSGIEDLEKLVGLKEKGFITDAEFEGKKKQLLGL
jgi:hypothetical protein